MFGVGTFYHLNQIFVTHTRLTRHLTGAGAERRRSTRRDKGLDTNITLTRSLMWILPDIQFTFVLSVESEI